MNYNTMLAGLRDLVDNPTPRVPVALCLDVSSICRDIIACLSRSTCRRAAAETAQAHSKTGLVPLPEVDNGGRCGGSGFRQAG